MNIILDRPVDRLLQRLDATRECGPGRWMAKCPAHEDRRPSLSIREAEDGRVLVHDFGGCPTPDVLAAIGLELADLFDRPLEGGRPLKQRHNHAAVEALKLLAAETLVLQIAADNLAHGNALDSADRARLAEAARKIREAREAV